MARKEDKIKKAVQFYFNTDRSKKAYTSTYKDIIALEYDTLIMHFKNNKDYLDAIKEELNKRKESEMLEIYEVMKKKALEGDVKSAEFVQKFLTSDFFGNSKSEIDNIIDNLEV